MNLGDSQSQKSKDYFVRLLCQIEASIAKSQTNLYYSIPSLYKKIIQCKVEQVEENLAGAKTEKNRIHAEHSLEVYKNAEYIL